MPTEPTDLILLFLKPKRRSQRRNRRRNSSPRKRARIKVPVPRRFLANDSPERYSHLLVVEGGTEHARLHTCDMCSEKPAEDAEQILSKSPGTLHYWPTRMGVHATQYVQLYITVNRTDQKMHQNS